MMAASEADTGEIDVSSYHDLIKVGADCNGAKLDVFDEKGNVRDDSDGSYVFLSDTGEVSTDDPISDKNCNADSNQVLDSMVDNGVEVQFGGVVVEDGGNGQSLAVEENHCALSVIEKVPNGEVVDLVTTGTVEEPNEMAVEENKNGQVDCEVEVEDQIELESVLNSKDDQESQITIKTDTNGELGESPGSVIVLVEDGNKSIKAAEKNNLDASAEFGEIRESLIKSPVVSDFSHKDVKLVEQNNLDSTVELKESPESNVMLLEDVDFFAKSLNPMDQNNLVSNADLGESRESVIKSPEAGELSYKSVKPEEQNNLNSTSESGESKNSQNVVLGAVGCELQDFETNVGEGKSKEQSEPESVTEVEESLDSEIRITRSVDSVSHQVDNEEKLKRMTDSGIDVDVAVKLANETDAPVEKGIVYEPDVVDNEVSSDKELNECIDESQRAIELIATPAIAASLPSPAVCAISENKIVKVPIECSGSITAGPDDGPVVEQGLAIADNNSRSVLIQGNEGANLGNETSKPQDAKTTCNPDLDGNKVAQTEEQCECINGSQKAAEWTGNPKHADSLPSPTICVLLKNEIGDVPDKSCGSFLASLDVGSVSDHGLVVAENVGSGLVQGHEPEKVVQDTDAPLKSETVTLPISDQNKISQNDDLGERIGGCPKSPELNRNHEIAENVISGCIITEGKIGELPVETDGSFQSGSNGGTIVEREIGSVNSPITVNYETCVINDAKIDMKVENHDSKNIESALFYVAEGTKPEIEVDNGLRSMLSSPSPSNCVSYGTKIEFGSINPAEIFSLSQCDDVLTESQFTNRDTECVYNQTITNYLDVENHVINSVPIGSCADIKSESDGQNSSAISNSDMPGEYAIVPESEGSNCDAVDGNNLGAENVTKPFQFLVRFPRFDDVKLRQQIRDAKLLVDEKTCRRDAIRDAIKTKRSYIQALDDKFEAAKSEKRDAMRSVELKRQEIDSVQVVINRVKNAISVQDINNRIYHLEHAIEHETLPLKEEKLLIREIKQLKQLRDELSSNMGSQDEVQQALDQRYHIEGRLKILKKELDGLKDKVSKSANAVYWSGKKYDEESTKLRELHAQYRAANGIRQEAYEHFRCLKDQLNEKIKYFRRYLDDVKAASDYALGGDKEALHRLCVNQVETVMEQWNKNDEFRKDYVRCNMRSTVRRLKTLDGRSLGPDEESPVLPNYVDETVDRYLSSPFKATSPLLVSTLEHDKTAPLVKGEVADGKSMEAAGSKSQMLESKTIAKLIPGSDSETVSRKVEAVETKVEEILQTEEELELARKAEVLQTEEIAANLKEQRRLEEKAKAQEALERKKRNAEKAQLRAELRAQKEAEQKEKEREKRMRKKDRKNIDGEIAPALELQSERKDIPTTVTKPKKTVRYTKQIKTIAAIPPALRNRGRKRLKQFMWWAFGALMVLLVFLVGNGGAFGSLKSRRVGIVTDKDIATRVIAEELRPDQTIVSKVMTRNPTFVTSDSLAIEALQKMVEGKFRHLPVVENGEVIALLDITKCLYDAISRMEKAAEQGSAIAAAVEGVERQWGSNFSAPTAFIEILRERMFKPSLSTIIAENAKVAIVSPSDPVHVAAKRMRELRVSSVIIMTGNKIQGILTSKDILMRVVALNLSPELTFVEKVMTPNPEHATVDTSILEALHIMHDGKFLHLPVLDREGCIAVCVDVLQITHAAISMVENSSGAVNDVANTVMQKFWDSALSLEPPDDYDTQSLSYSEMSMSGLNTLDGSEPAKSTYPSLGLGNSFAFKFEDLKGRVHRFNFGTENLDELVSAVMRRIGTANDQNCPQLLYEDDEGDKVLLTTDGDLASAVGHARSVGLKVLRLHLDYSELSQQKTESQSQSQSGTATTQSTEERRRRVSLQSGVLASAVVLTSIGVLVYLKRSKQ